MKTAYLVNKINEQFLNEQQSLRPELGKYVCKWYSQEWLVNVFTGGYM